MSLKDELNVKMAARRRLKILKLLACAPLYILDEVALQGQLAAVASPVAVAGLHDDLRHLRDRDCLRLDTSEGVWLAELTRTGNDVADGLAEVDGVARPGPGA